MFRIARVQGETLIIIKPLCRRTWVLISFILLLHSLNLQHGNWPINQPNVGFGSRENILLPLLFVRKIGGCWFVPGVSLPITMLMLWMLHITLMFCQLCHHQLLIEHKQRVGNIGINFNGGKACIFLQIDWWYLNPLKPAVLVSIFVCVSYSLV